MAEQPTSRSRPFGETGGSPQRPGQRLAGPVLTFDLEAELEQLRREATWRQGDRNARTLVKEPDFRIVLTIMKNGARLQEHSAPGPVSVHTLVGRLRLHVPDGTVDLPSGHLLALDGNVPHDVEALEESAFLLTIGWSKGL
jgi:quercetin dioxygenase-like cupin family protein